MLSVVFRRVKISDIWGFYEDLLFVYGYGRGGEEFKLQVF
jgi:hypothetical protein